MLDKVNIENMQIFRVCTGDTHWGTFATRELAEEYIKKIEQDNLNSFYKCLTIQCDVLIFSLEELDSV